MSASWPDESVTEDFNFDTIETVDVPDTDPFPSFTDREPDESDPDMGGSYSEPGPDILKTPRRAKHAREYQDKTVDILQMAIAWTAPNEATVDDAATILLYGEQVAQTVGDLAAEDPRVASAINFLNGGTSNPYAAALMAVAPLVLQVIRNHEPSLESVSGIHIPFTKFRIRFPGKFKIKLGRLRAATHDPETVYNSVFTNPNVIKAMEKKGIRVAKHRR